MNKKFLIKIPLKDLDTKETHVNINIHTTLDPFYVSETALLSMFMDEEEYTTYSQKAREVIFNASIRADSFVYGKLRNLPEEHVLMLKRELALCLAMNNFAKHFYKGLADSVHRSKTFAEFTVTTTVKNSPHLLRDMIDNSNNCIEEAKKAIDDINQVSMGAGKWMVKGRLNTSSAFSYRLWFHNNLPEKSNKIFASEKVWYLGNRYKDGDVIDVSATRTYYPQRNT